MKPIQFTDYQRGYLAGSAATGKAWLLTLFYFASLAALFYFLRG